MTPAEVNRTNSVWWSRATYDATGKPIAPPAPPIQPPPKHGDWWMRAMPQPKGETK
jgi:hypothetical protein